MPGLRGILGRCLTGLAIAALVPLAADFHPGLAAGQEVAGDKGGVVLAPVEDLAVTPVLARFIERVIDYGEEINAAAVVIELDTPGGLLESTRTIVKDILASRVPVVVFVSPSGGRAASAGVFITYAAHIAAMRSGTHIGAAHPVSLAPGSSPRPEESAQDSTGGGQSALEDKILNDTVAWIRSLADLRERNADWAEKAVVESVSITEDVALELGVIDLTADDLESLLRALDGRQVQVAGGAVVTLKVAGADVQTVEMWWGEELLGAIANPNIALILLVLGFYGVLFELNSPGWGVPGTLGVVCLVMGFFAMAVLPINMAGLALVLVALALFVAEAFVTSFGALTIGGVACLILGGLMLVDSPAGFMRVSASVVVPIALATAAISFFLVGSIVRAHRMAVRTGTEAIIGTRARATEDFVPHVDGYSGFVRIHGELWRAISTVPIADGQELAVSAVNGLVLRVALAAEDEPGP